MQALRDASACAELIRDIIRDIKIFSRPEGQQLGPTDVHRVLDSALRMAQNQLFHRARLVKDYGELPSCARQRGAAGAGLPQPRHQRGPGHPRGPQRRA